MLVTAGIADAGSARLGTDPGNSHDLPSATLETMRLRTGQRWGLCQGMIAGAGERARGGHAEPDADARLTTNPSLPRPGETSRWIRGKE